MSEKEKLDKLNARYKKQNDKIQANYDRVSAILPKGTTDRIKALGTSTNQFVKNAVMPELNRMERAQKAPKQPPKELNGKRVYRFWEEDEYIHAREWWHEIVFFHDDMELNDLFVKVLDSEAEENKNFQDGCRIMYDLVNLSRVKPKYTDLDLDRMTDEELEKIPDSELEESTDQTEELKELMKAYLESGNEKPLLEFIGFYELADATK